MNTVKKRLADGSVVVYHYDRSSGRRIDADPGSPAFAQAQALVARLPRREDVELPKVGAFRRILTAFRQSPAYRKQSPHWQIQLDRWGEAAADRFQHLSEKHLADRRFRGELLRWQDELADRPRTADLMVSVVRRLIGWAYDRGMVDYDHTRAVKKVWPGGRRQELTFSPEMLTAVQAARSDLWDAVELALWTGARQSDLLALRWDQIDAEGWLVYTPSKGSRTGGRSVALPTHLLPPLRALLGRIPRLGPTILANPSTGRPWTGNAARKALLKVLRRAGLPERHWHDLRGTLVQMLADAGCTPDEQGAISGHAVGTGGIAAYKTKSRPLAEAAYRKLAKAVRSGRGPLGRQ